MSRSLRKRPKSVVYYRVNLERRTSLELDKEKRKKKEKVEDHYDLVGLPLSLLAISVGRHAYSREDLVSA